MSTPPPEPDGASAKPEPTPKLNLPGSAPRDPLAALRLMLRQRVQRAVAEVIASAIVTRMALAKLVDADMPEFERGQVRAALAEISEAVEEVDGLTGLLVDAALESSAAQESALAKCPEAIRRAVEGGLKQAGAMIGAVGRAGVGGPPKLVLPN